jgi:hypothetical protein
MDDSSPRSKWKRSSTTREVKKKYTTPQPNVHLKLNRYSKLKSFKGVHPVAAISVLLEESRPKTCKSISKIEKPAPNTQAKTRGKMHFCSSKKRGLIVNLGMKWT